MGREVLRALAGDPRFALTGATCSAASTLLGQDVSQIEKGLPPVRLCADAQEALEGASVAVDFSLPAATPSHLAACERSGVALVLCTTGHDQAQLARLDKAAAQIPLLVAANTSLGINLLASLVELAAGALGEDFDAEILEAHHRNKRDLPSGTALQLGRAVARGRGHDPEEVLEHRLPGKEALRTAGSVGLSALRAGDISGEHTVLFAGTGERLELVHRVSSRATFAVGALTAAHWLAGRPAGRYTMQDALGLK